MLIIAKTIIMDSKQQLVNNLARGPTNISKRYLIIIAAMLIPIIVFNIIGLIYNGDNESSNANIIFDILISVLFYNFFLLVIIYLNINYITNVFKIRPPFLTMCYSGILLTLIIIALLTAIISFILVFISDYCDICAQLLVVSFGLIFSYMLMTILAVFTVYDIRKIKYQNSSPTFVNSETSPIHSMLNFKYSELKPVNV
jgi:hypothetical protein